MAARLNPRHSEMVRSKIKASQLINRLQRHALGDDEMSDTQVRAATFLIGKIVANPPEQKDVTVTGELRHGVEIHIVDHRPDQG